MTKDLEIEPQRHFVTGGAGFIGSHLVERLLAAGKRVTVYDNLASGRLTWIERHLSNPAFRFERADLLNADRLTEEMANHDLVWHLGANTDIPSGCEDVNLDLRNCVLATHNTLEAMRKNGIREIIFSSTSAVYGEAPESPTPETAGPLRPISLYGAAKLSCEALVSSYCHLFGLQAWMFRFANVIGARMGHGVIFDFIQKLRRDPHHLEVWGDGRQRKPFFLVEDCIDGMVSARRRSDDWCDVFNLGCDTTTGVDRVAEIVIEEMGLPNVEVHHTGGRRGFPGDVPVLMLDTGKIETLGWRARHISDDAVRIAARRLLGKEQPAAVGSASDGGTTP